MRFAAARLFAAGKRPSAMAPNAGPAEEILSTGSRQDSPLKEELGASRALSVRAGGARNSDVKTFRGGVLTGVKTVRWFSHEKGYWYEDDSSV
jgi:hypothetical protein